MKEINKHILENTLKQLPAFNADPNIWDKIKYKLSREAQEVNYDILQQSIKKLNRFNADEKIWNKIETTLRRKNKTKNRLLFLKVAASVIILIGISRWATKQLSNRNEKEYITYSQEVVVKIHTGDYSVELEKKVSDIIAQQCRTQPDVCTNPLFTELNKEYSDLEKSLVQIRLLSKNSNNDSDVNKYILRIQKEKLELSKKMLQLLSVINEG